MAITRKKSKRTEVEDLMALQLRENDLIGFKRDAQFVDGRRFRADFLWPKLKLVLEVDGGVWMPKGGHTTGKGYTSDRERDVEAALQGFLTIRYVSEQVRSGYAIETFRQIHAARKAELAADDS